MTIMWLVYHTSFQILVQSCSHKRSQGPRKTAQVYQCNKTFHMIYIWSGSVPSEKTKFNLGSSQCVLPFPLKVNHYHINVAFVHTASHILKTYLWNYKNTITVEPECIIYYKKNEAAVFRWHADHSLTLAATHMGEQRRGESTAKWGGQLWVGRSDRWRSAAGHPIHPQTWYIDSCQEDAQEPFLPGMQLGQFTTLTRRTVGCVVYDNDTELCVCSVSQCGLCVYCSVDNVCTTVILSIGLYRLYQLFRWSTSYIF